MEPLAADDPRQIGAYRLLRRLGAGGMGRVYLGRTAGGRTVAVKVVRPELADDPEFRARFRQEVSAARLVGGARTAPVLDADTEGPQPWVATGYVAGPALGVAVRRFGPLPGPAVHLLGADLAGALAHVHTLGLVHRDVKPSNVLLALDGPRLIDFGISRALDGAAELTRSGFVVGSPGFMSPEQAAGARSGPASDVFSLGAVLAYAATGTAPFGEGVSAAVLLYRVLHEEPDLDGVPDGLRAVVGECLAKRPEDRPAPGALRERLLAAGVPDPADGGWLPPALSAAVGRSAVELLDLEGEAAGQAAAPGDRHPTELDGPRTTGRPPGGTPATGTGGSGRRRRPLVAAAAVLVAAVIGAALWIQSLPDGGAHRSQDGAAASAASSGGPATAATPAGTAGTPAARTSSDGPASPAASGGAALPAGYLGTWKGPITTQIVPLASDFEVELTAGRVGEKVGRTSNASRLSSTVCHGELTLLSAAADRIVVQERPAPGDGAGCTGTPEKQTYTLTDARTLHLQVSEAPLGSDPSGDLTAQGAPRP
ncbi:serine/threonine-protein kinase [Kitasatospora sp. NPDC094015]|uniref:serine/threonine-protein kinase n=1 Tax=Kitasatospora sp. NPDC094015 TaxID=3155205 RepID=UPI003329E5B4